MTPSSSHHHTDSDSLFMDSAAFDFLRELRSHSDFTAADLLEATGDSASRTGRALLEADSHWTGLLTSTAQRYREHLHEVTTFIQQAFYSDTTCEAALCH